MINKIQSALKKEINLRDIKTRLSGRETIQLINFTGSSASFLYHELSRSEGVVLVLTEDQEKAAAVASDIEQMGSSGVYLFPATRRKPYDDQKIVDTSTLVQRSEVLEQIQTGNAKVVTAPLEAIFDKLVPPEQFSGASLTLKKGMPLSPEDLSTQLTEQGYGTQRFVGSPGEFAIRGGIFDIFPFSGEYPIRLEFFGDEIDTIREFDPDSQRSVAFLDHCRIVPNAAFSGAANKETLLSYLPDSAILAVDEPDLFRSRIEEFTEQAEKRYAELDDEDLNRPEDEYLSLREWDETIQKYGIITSGSMNRSGHTGLKAELNSAPHPSFNGSFKVLRSFISEKSAAGIQTIILCNHENQKERFEELLGEPSEEFSYLLAVHSLHQGFILPGQKLAVLTDHEIFNRYHRPKTKRKQVRGGISLKELKDLNVGDYVVHVDYGIATFAGFKKIDVRNTVQEAAVLRYKDDSILYVNVSSLHKLQKYSGKEGKKPRITKLGSGEWARKKATTRKKVKDIARELIQLYAKRKAMEAFSFSEDQSWQTEMEARFEFEETPDQMEAIEAVKRDMESHQPMDRLICGDVGFGKTEVAMRAAFKAVMDQKQVAILVPTTILADQHAKTFQERMKDFPVVVESLSRFRTTAEQKQIVKDLEAGKVDILIGTHRIVSKDVKFKDLGLLVIDEEQRFGVSVKEKLKKFRASVDVMTMTATPIPRTLQFSLMGARDLSIINTPPSNRQPVYTEIHSFDTELIRDSILQETSRGGQIFFINNRVKNIKEVTEMIRELVPNIKIRTAHGQMKPSSLEKIIQDFYQHKFDVLISTNIVENGIDISNANTIIINNANQFGLSELHQLRGRVGRSNRKAFCYLITPPIRSLSEDARKRLMALEEHSDLGSGFNIAMRDLDIRGAGDILGAEQSGFITDIGFEMYTKILDDAVRELKETEFSSMFSSEPKSIELPDTLVEFDHSAYLENSYVSDNVERLNLYRKLAEASSSKQIDDWEEELKDRFGPMPKSAVFLVLATRIKLAASKRLVKKITIRANRMWLQFPKHKSDLGEKFYGNGYFQKILKDVEENSGKSFEVIQKKDAVRLVIQNIPDSDAALDYLRGLVHFDQREESVPA
ncbi:transcription-repair coupling factor [Rhodohalobacter sp. SW132]|uniref:transcription-repair coupling factor n=1 Tax=Rhodohalobacter sp. SW132 TaxID=2293433 RepID=UPI000E278D47|nr:transcription-repair coupling factor [Rhodohalobacter sp. SW132]REL37705.1 transcription-repair coupling factor [Rhodohalobacter sp. SW132]